MKGDLLMVRFMTVCAALVVMLLFGCGDETNNDYTVNPGYGGPPGATLGEAGSYAILSGVGVTNTGATTTISGDVGVSPGNALVGLPVGQPKPGSIHKADPAAAAAQLALTKTYDDLAGRACDATVSGDLGGRTFGPNVYCSASSMGITGEVTLDGQGNSGSVFIFQVGSALTTAAGSSVNLIGGAQAKNVYWQVGSSATLGTGSTFRGNIVALQSITVGSGAKLTGRALARNGSVTLDANAVSRP